MLHHPQISRRRFQAVLCGLLALAHGQLQAARPAKIPTAPPPPIDHLTAATNAFAMRLLALPLDEPGKNQFFSPLSIELALSIAMEGARGLTAQEMGSVLQFPASLAVEPAGSQQPWNLHSLQREIEAFSAWLAKPSPSREQYELQIANGLWVDQSFPLAPDYSQRIKQHYGAARAEQVDFQGAPDAQRQKVNDWVSQQTQRKIEELLAPGTVDALTRLIIANAIYFKGQWKVPFETKHTKPQSFKLTGGSTSEVPMMNARNFKLGRYAAFRSDGQLYVTPKLMGDGFLDAYGYPPEDGFQALELDYQGDDISMLILLPLSADGLPRLIDSITIERLQSITQQLDDREVHLTLPTFKIESTYPLVEPLQQLGMRQAFSDLADFTGMTSSQSPEDRLKIALVVHKAFVEVNEEGTEAAAATGVVMSRTAAVPRQPFIPSFTADHPFLFFIRERTSGLLLFVGKLEQPQSPSSSLR